MRINKDAFYIELAIEWVLCQDTRVFQISSDWVQPLLLSCTLSQDPADSDLQPESPAWLLLKLATDTLALSLVLPHQLKPSRSKYWEMNNKMKFNTLVNRKIFNLLSNDATQVEVITSAAPIIFSSACLLSFLNLFSSLLDSSPNSSFSLNSLCNEENSGVWIWRTCLCNVRKSTLELIDSLDFAHTLTTWSNLFLVFFGILPLNLLH